MTSGPLRGLLALLERPPYALCCVCAVLLLLLRVSVSNGGYVFFVCDLVFVLFCFYLECLSCQGATARGLRLTAALVRAMATENFKLV